MLSLPSDIVEYVSQNFAETEIPVVLATLKNAKLHDGENPDFRMLRCALVASGNSVEGVKRLVSDLATDFRDVIVAGEYISKDGGLVKARDLSSPLTLMKSE